MPEDAKKPYHHGNLREALLDAAETALSEMPLEHVSLREIARRAGVSHAAPKHHFGSLGNLLGDVSGRGFERFAATLQDAAERAHDQSAPARLLAMARAYLNFAINNRGVYGLMFGKMAAVERTPRYTEAAFAAWSLLEQEVAAIVGPQRAVNGAVMLWSAVHGFSMLHLDRSTPPHIDPQQAMEAVARMSIAGVVADA